MAQLNNYNRYIQNTIGRGENFNRHGDTISENNMFILMSLLQQTKVFIVEDDIKFLLFRTDNKITIKKLPFDNFFLETNMSFTWNKNNKVYQNAGFHICNWGKKQIPHLFFYFDDGKIIDSRGFPLFEKFDAKKEYKRHQDYYKETPPTISIDKEFVLETEDLVQRIQLFVINFIDFLNNPEVSLVTVDRTKKQNQKRIQQGKLLIPTQKFIRIDGKLKIYLDELKSGKEFSYSHRFWVRGHFRTLRSEKWKNKRGTKLWIPPYIKGKGILVERIYDVNTRSS